MNINTNDIDSFVDYTRDVIYLRELDHILIIRPNKLQHLNPTAFEFLFNLYEKHVPFDTLLDRLQKKYSIHKDTLRHDMILLFETINAIVNDDYNRAPLIQTIPFDPNSISMPVLSEIALTYNCQNKCEFCYASSPYRGKTLHEMTTDETKLIIKKIKEEAQVPTISFTGGEPTLRKDLPELIKYATDLGMRANLITNGLLASNKDFTKKLFDAGLKSAQVSLESHDEDLHNLIVGNKNAYKKTVQGIRNLSESGIFTHTNTTINQRNKNNLKEVVKFVKEEFDFPYLSMNMIIKTGVAKDNTNIDLSYTEISSIVEPVIDYCEKLGIKFVWYSPTPYCLFNPVDFNLGAKSCACVSGLLSVNPAGDILPCSSFDRGIGNLLQKSFDKIWTSDAAMYWREKRFMPPVCKGCEYEIACGGACPLYWENAANFDEIENVRGDKPYLKNFLWKVENSLRVKSRGIKGIKNIGG